jgi:hypothetical protein
VLQSMCDMFAISLFLMFGILLVLIWIYPPTLAIVGFIYVLLCMGGWIHP